MGIFKVKPGALHKQLGYPSSQHIPLPVLRRIHDLPVGGKIQKHTVTRLMKKRANFAMHARSWRA